MDALARDIGGDSFGALGHLRRYWWLALLGAFLGLVAGIAYTGSVAKTYSSTTLLEVLPPPVQTSVTGARINSSVNMDNELQFVSSVAVAEAAKKLLQIDTDVTDLQAQVTSQVPANTSFIQITFTGISPERARAGSHAFAVAYVNARTDSARSAVAVQAEGITKQLTDLTTKLTAATSIAATGLSNSPTRELAIANVNILTNQITTLQQRLSPLVTTDLTAAEITNDADLPDAPSKPVPALYIGGALFAGLVGGLALMVLAARFDRKIRDKNDIEHRVGRSVLGEIRNKTKSKELPGVLAARSGGEQFDRLRLRLESAKGDRPHSLLVCAVGTGAAASFGAANIAASEARAGHEAVLICANPDSAAARLFALPDSPGLSGWLLDTADLDTVSQRVTGRPRLSVIAPGKTLTDVFDIVPVERVAALVDSLVAAGKHVIVEAPALGRGAQALELAHRVGVTVVVVELVRSKVPEVADTFHELEQMGAYAPGVVIVPSMPADSNASAEPVGAPPAKATVPAAG